MNKLLKEARALLSDVVQRGVRVGTETRIESFLRRTAGKRSTKGKKASAARKAAKRAQHQDSTASIREAVGARAAGVCEARAWRGGGHGWPDAMDHWEGGSGRRREKQSVETCWMLCVFCNGDRTKNYPSAAFWNDIRRAHCNHYGYPFIAHIVHEPLTRKAT